VDGETNATVDNAHTDPASVFLNLNDFADDETENTRLRNNGSIGSSGARHSRGC
jgi:hypothetical protein